MPQPRRGEPPPLRFLRFADLMAMGLVRNYPALERLIKNYAFPVGRWLGTNTRCWTVDEVEAWLANRPTERPVPTTARQEAEFHGEDYPEEQPPTGEP